MLRTRSRTALLFSALLEIYGWPALSPTGPAFTGMNAEAASCFLLILSNGKAIGLRRAGDLRSSRKPSLQKPPPRLLQSHRNLFRHRKASSLKATAWRIHGHIWAPSLLRPATPRSKK